jgi:tetratricopeptide (TPR) repeat protein
MVDRLLVELSGDGQITVSMPQDGGPREAVSRVLLEWPLDGDALEDLRWYLEDYLRGPFGAWEERGPAILLRLPTWGHQIFDSVFGSRLAKDAYQRAREQGLELVFCSSEPGMLSLPWELMSDSDGPVALHLAGMSRALRIPDMTETVHAVGDRLRVLMVVARPGGTRDVGYRMIARPLLERLGVVRGEVNLTVLRPPTLDALRDTLTAAVEVGEPFHVVHFDGHGSLRDGREGLLALEHPYGGPHRVSASAFAGVVCAGQVPVVVLNACQSGAIGKELEAAVATALLEAGCQSVVAMAYSVYATAAAEFMVDFYDALFTGGTVSKAVTAGRRRLFERDRRPSPKGDLPLSDWLVPVHYLRGDVAFPHALKARRAGGLAPDAELDQLRNAAPRPDDSEDELSMAGTFVGRDDLFYELESATRLERVVVLHGPGGTGKTEVAKGFGRWWRDTGGVDQPGWVFWHSFESGVASFGLDGVITEIGLTTFGPGFSRLDSDQRLAMVKDLLAECRLLLIWDNFESVLSMPDSAGISPPLDDDGRHALREFLAWLVGNGRSAVIITSRTSEDWLGAVRRIQVGGLNAGEAAEYASHLLAPYTASAPRRERRAFGELLEWLNGHPLSMRLILPRLRTTEPEALLTALHGTHPFPVENETASGPSSLAASITYSFTHLTSATRQLLPALSLLRGVADTGVLAAFSSAMGVPEQFAAASVEEWTTALEDAGRVGLLSPIGSGMYRIHPILPSYVAAGWRAEHSGDYEAIRDSSLCALSAACARLCRRLSQQIAAGDAGHAYAVIELQQRTLGTMLRYGLDHQLWADAEDIARSLEDFWDNKGLDEEAAAWANHIQVVTTDGTGMPSALSSPAGGLWLFSTGAQANRQQTKGRLEEAERTHRQILTALNAEPESRATQARITVSYNQLGMTAYLQGRLEQAEDWYRKALDSAQEVGYQAQVGAVLHNLGIVTQEQERLDDAENWYRQARTIREELGDQPGMANTYHQLGMVAKLRGQLDDAEDLYLKALSIYTELGDRPHMAGSFHELGITARSRGRLDSAEDWFRRSLVIKEELGNRSGTADTYQNLGIIAQDRGQLDDAEDWYRRSLAIKQELANRPGMALSYGQLALLSYAKGQKQQALEWIIRCTGMFDEFPHPLTQRAPEVLAFLTVELGMHALEASWQEITGQSLPEAVRDYVLSWATTNSQPEGER